MISDYIVVGFLALFGILFGAGVIIIAHILAPRKKNPVKGIPYESGIDPVGDARIRFNVKFYLIAMLFIIFDVEAVFFYPWAVVYKELLSFGDFILYEMILFIVLLLFGYYYLFKKGVFDWD